MIDVAEVLVHWHAGRSLDEIAESLGVDRKTVRKYVAPAIEAGLSPGGPARSAAVWAELVRAWAECHVEAFAFFGAVPNRLVPVAVGSARVVRRRVNDRDEASPTPLYSLAKQNIR